MWKNTVHVRVPDTSERVFRGSLPLQLFYKMRCV